MKIMAASAISLIIRLSRALQPHRAARCVSGVAGNRALHTVGHLNKRGTSWSRYTALRKVSVDAGQYEHTEHGSGTEEKGDSNKGLQLSDSCVKQINKVTGGEVDSMLRIVVEGGGCSGFQYKFDLDTTSSPDDRVFERNGAKVVIDELSLSLLEGSTVDYQQELIRSSFRIIDNPNAELGCSCGASFALK